MPVYEYQCTECKERFERQQRFSEEPVRDCPICGAAVRRVYQPVGIIFKGSGFYVTDNRKDSGEKAGEPAAAGTKTSDGAAASTSSDSSKSEPSKAASGSSEKAATASSSSTSGGD